MTGQEWHDRACARTRTRTAASHEVGVSGTASTAAAVEEQQHQEESSLLPLNNTLMNVMELNTMHDETNMAFQPGANKTKSTAGSVIFQEGSIFSEIAPRVLSDRQIVQVEKSQKEPDHIQRWHRTRLPRVHTSLLRHSERRDRRRR